ncbi:MAG: PIG-L family deacetylase [Candidatus Didemnitutus sp.]|nr:PIG-L family deacetylase [Candidatus Didemnitutus sp.]
MLSRRLPLALHTLNRIRPVLLVGASLLATPLALADPAPAPLAPAAIAQELRSLRTVGTVLHIGAHPDDENTELITYLARGRGFRTAYLSLTRGDGGQNELGRDFDEKLGVLRTQELLAARRIDTGRQFFTRAIDFGFSKTPEETLAFWDKKEVLGDVVRIIRQFRPDVIVTRFPVPPGSGGHGHHTASAILAVEAFKLAGDPTAYPEQLAQGLTPWQPRRVLWNVFRFGGPANAPLPLPGTPFSEDIAGTDAASGQEFGQIAALSRSQHKTQGLGGFALRPRTGPNGQTFLLLAGEPATSDLMDGVDTTWKRYPGGAAIDAALEKIIADFKPDAPAASLPGLLAVRKQLAVLPSDAVVADKRAQLDRVLLSVVKLQVNSTVTQPEFVAGEKLTIESSISFQLSILTRPVMFFEGTHVRIGVSDTFVRSPAAVSHSTITHADATVTIPTATSVSQPYWLREPGAAGIAQVSDPSLISLPDNPPVVELVHEFRIDDQTISVADEPQFVTRDGQGEHRRGVEIIPPVSLAFASEIFFVAPGAAKPVAVTITAARAGRGTLRLRAPAGWTVAPAEQPFAFDQPDAKATFTFTLTAPATGGAGRLAAEAEIGGHVYSNKRVELHYAHLPLILLQPPASVRVASFDLALRGKNIGYLPGAGDYVAECLEQMGCTVRRLAGSDLTPEKLAGLDAVVIGVRAFNERADLKDHLVGLFAWVEQGGTVIAQYNRPNGLAAPTLAPYALSIEGPAPALRVTDERAPVTALAEHPALTRPNLITAADWDGWVQERGAYFPSKWDEAHFTPLLAMSDPGETPLKSSLLVARHGKGYYVYTGLAFFRQLPAGVPGAWRLFANLVSLHDE